jgi:hypothetical protein
MQEIKKRNTNAIFNGLAVLQRLNCIAGFEVLTAVVMIISFLWDIGVCNPYMNRRFGGTYHLHLQGRKSAEQETSVRACG